MEKRGGARPTNKTCESCGKSYVAPTQARKRCDDCRKCEQCGGQCFRSERRFCSYPCSVEYARAHREEPKVRIYEGEKYPYTRLAYGRHMFTEHVLVWVAEHGPVPAGHVIHHINEDSQDNRIENLIAVTHRQHRWLHSPNYRLTVGGEWERRCTRCDTWKPADPSLFHMYRSNGSELPMNFGPCLECKWSTPRHQNTLRPPAN